MSEPTAAHATALVGRELPSAVNTPELLAEHARATAGKVRTRFPPEPNGYLHLGHAKSMNMNFALAFEKLGVPPEGRQTFFRYDDTNPEAESSEYVQSLAEDVAWLGWQPDPTTFTSDYFPVLYDLAVTLIRTGKAYVCHQSKAQIEACREVAKAKAADPAAEGDPCSPWRERPVEESLRLFADMRKGKFDANAATLRLKMDMNSPNPNMWDQVAYRIKYVAHPHAGSDWCIYPTYDYTHCIVDSLEHIDYSICTLEFESRRESYFWVLEALNMYRPRVYEMSRLNVSYTVLSKRKLLKLVESGFVRGWDDPRMPTVKGLRRRGYTRHILNSFCDEIGATRNENVVQYERLNAIARNTLHDVAPRLMAVLDPLLVLLTGHTTTSVSAPAFPFDPTRGAHEVALGAALFIERADFRVEDSEDFHGLAPGKCVTLKYAFCIRCDRVESDASGAVTALHCSVAGGEEKPRGAIHWVDRATALLAEVRMYEPLFTVEEPSDDWWAELNRGSETVVRDALVDPHVLRCAPLPETHLQLERIGFVVVDRDSVAAEGTRSGLVLNLTVPLKDSKPRVAGAPSRSRKEEQARQLADKQARMHIAPEDMFRSATELYSAFDAEGVPTHDAAGEKLSKSAYKGLKKEWEKQKKIYDKHTSSAV